MNYILNDLGVAFFKKSEKELFQYFYYILTYIIVFTFISILGAKNTLHLYFAFLLLILGVIIFLIAMFSFARNLNRTISDIKINADGSISLTTSKVLFFKSISINVKRESLKFYPQKFQINTKESEEGWKIILDSKNSFYLYKPFFDKTLEQQLAN
jgi:hypothetical protein